MKFTREGLQLNLLLASVAEIELDTSAEYLVKGRRKYQQKKKKQKIKEVHGG